jgi:hypothetical protein
MAKPPETDLLNSCAFHGLDNAGAHDQNAVAHELNDTTVIADDQGLLGFPCGGS